MVMLISAFALAIVLDVAGGCPGKTLLTVTSATPSADVRLLSGTTTGGDVIVVDGCTVTTGLASPVARKLAAADASGNLNMSPTLGAGACGMFMQALDVTTCTLSAASQIPLAGQSVGPDMTADGWTQCQGYYDTAGGVEIPTAWGADCAGPSDNEVRVVCGRDLSTYRYIDVSKNPFRDGLVAYPETGLIYNANFAYAENQIYATGNHPHVAVSWWQNGNGCSETSLNLTVNNGCTWEASNCFGQNLAGDRYLWIYTKP